MLNGLALRNGFEAAPKVRKNRFEYSATTREGAPSLQELDLIPEPAAFFLYFRCRTGGGQMESNGIANANVLPGQREQVDNGGRASVP
jgi:hypothetical protein